MRVITKHGLNNAHKSYRVNHSETKQPNLKIRDVHKLQFKEFGKPLPLFQIENSREKILKTES